MLQQINKENFQDVLTNNEIVLLDFYADWCGPCQVLLPTLDKVSEEFEGKATIAKVNVDNNPELSVEFGVRSIPALFYFKNGELIDRQSGVQSQSAIKETLSRLLAN